MEANDELLRRSQQLQLQVTEAREAYFFNEVIFSYQWFLLLGTLIASYWIFWRLVDRGRLQPILLVGLLVFGISLVADGIGGSYLLWDYPRMAMPWGPRLISADLIIPVGYMLIYQWTRAWRPFFACCVALGAVYAFVLEPLAIAAEIYEVFAWRFIYSFPIFVGIGLLAKGAADAAERTQRSESAA